MILITTVQQLEFDNISYNFKLFQLLLHVFYINSTNKLRISMEMIAWIEVTKFLTYRTSHGASLALGTVLPSLIYVKPLNCINFFTK